MWPKKCTIAVQWSKEKYCSLTDQLLTLIEAKPHYCQAFGFSKDITGNVSSSQKKTAELYKLKKAYCEHHEELGATGQGLVESGCQDEITAGSKLANIWGPWQP
ncbi:hypothetical protein L208DRAFT_1381086 [Tricholoma matsutake]|nr:hypothetical protein L208DRAFT_1381086 [Tricholoma matsutake 945]